MKLAEALILRADLQKRIEQLRERLKRNAQVQEGDRPAEKPETLITELEELTAQLQTLIRSINHTNCAARLGDGMLIVDALARRDALNLLRSAYTDLVEAATVKGSRYSKSEVRFLPTVDVAATQKRIDGLAREHRELDARIQEANWRVDLSQ
jgi:hypothetical protein